MNGNELNSMAQRYKEEMMRLYKKSGASSHSASEQGGQSKSRQNGASGGLETAVNDNAQGGSRSTSSGAGLYGANQASRQMTNIPVSCECRFPTAESIINSIAQTPAALSEADGNNSQSGRTTGFKGIMLNSSPDEAVYTVPSESENPQEIMPGFPMPADIPADSSEAVPQTSSFLPSMSWTSATGDNSWGFLQFDVFTAGRAYPVQGALITVTKELSEGSGLVRVLFSSRNGLTATIALPAPSAALSQAPQSTSRPFSEYSITVRAKDYYTVRDIRIPVFAGIKTVQPIDLIPLPEYGGLQPRNHSESNSENSITDTPAVG